MTANNSKAQKALRKAQAEERAAERAKRGDEGQIALLDLRLGVDKGASRERSRLGE